jgi:hypothetical protein
MKPASGRVALLAPSLLAAAVLMHGQAKDRVLAVAATGLLCMWLVMMLAVGTRWIERRDSSWTRLEVLTGAGRTMMWAGAGALVLASITGWASASVLGVLGLGATYLAVTWTAIVAGGEGPWRDATIERVLEPQGATEGDVVHERVRLAGVKIPAGMRLFGTGRAWRHGAATRYALGAELSGASVELESELGAAPRGEHKTPAMAWWLGDILGLARGPIIYRGEATLTVVPRPRAVDGTRELLGAGGDAATTVPSQRLPTEGTFRVREYVTGDDTRRIHWVRSLQADKLVVRLPDEIPIAQPKIRVVLDSQLWGADTLTCIGASQLLDQLVGIWLGVGKALAATGTRVTMVAAVAGPNGPVAAERRIHARASREVLKLGARAAWQDALPVAGLLAPGVRHVVITARPQQHVGDVVQIVVPEASFTTFEPESVRPPPVTLLYPIGSGDNRIERQRAEQARIKAMWRDRGQLGELLWHARNAPSGTYVARPHNGRVTLEVAS